MRVCVCECVSVCACVCARVCVHVRACVCKHCASHTVRVWSTHVFSKRSKTYVTTVPIEPWWIDPLLSLLVCVCAGVCVTW